MMEIYFIVLSYFQRYGKPLVLDMMEMNLMELIENRFNDIQPELYQQILSKDILKDRKYVFNMYFINIPVYKIRFIIDTNYIMIIKQMDCLTRG